MAERLDTLWHLVRRIFSSAEDATSDGLLLDRFVRQRDEAAFAELVRRHGPMVLGVCRRILHDNHAAEDAFQVTFLTLTCKASSLRRSQAVAGWLHRVARHVALRARARSRRAAEIERQVATMQQPQPSTEPGWRELAGVLDEELERLPERYRGPLVLCGLEGKTHEEAARALGWPIGSLSKRLARARELLRDRLARRGFAVSVPALAALLIPDATAAVPTALLSETVRSALLVAAGETTGLAAGTITLLRETLQAMFWNRTKTALAVLILGAALLAPAVGIGLLTMAPAAPVPERTTPVGQDVVPPKLRGLVAALGKKQFRFTAPFVRIAYSADGKLLAVSDYDMIHLYDAATKKELRTWETRPGSQVQSLAFSPDGATLAVADQLPGLRLYSVATGKLTEEFETHPSGARFVTFSPDGKLIATAGEERDPNHRDDGKSDRNDFSVRVVDAKTGRPAPAFAQAVRGNNCVAFSHDSKLLAWGAWDGSVHVQKVANGDNVFTVADPNPMPRPIVCVDFSPDTKLLAVGNGEVIRLLDAGTGKELKTLKQEAKPGQQAYLDGYGVRFSPDGKTLASICQAGVALWNVGAGKLARILRSNAGEVPTDLRFSRDGTKLISSATDGSVRFWDVATGNEDVEEGHSGPVNPVALSPDGKLVVTGSYLESVRFWDRATGKELRRFTKWPVRAISFIPDGLLIAGAGEDHLIRLFDPATGKEKATVGKDLTVGMCMTVSADGKLLALGQQTVEIYELPSGKQKLKLAGLGSYCAGVAFGPEGKTLVTVGQETLLPSQTYAIKLWDLTTGKEIRRLNHPPERAVNRVAWSPDGRYVMTDYATYDFGPPPIKDFATAKVAEGPGNFGSGFAPGGNVMAFSPDGKLFAMGCEEAQAKNTPWVGVWDTATWERIAKLEGHTQRVVSLAFSADGKFLVSGSMDTSALVWDVAELKKK